MRASGVLLPIFSLPGKYGIGCLSDEAYHFVKYLKKAKQKYWQILPVGPTSYGDSPYQSFSTFAGTPYFISLESLIRDGLLTEEECDKVDMGDDEESIDYGKMYEGRYKLLRKAYRRAKAGSDKEFKKFTKKNEAWLHDYAMFMAIKDSYEGKSFLEWEEPLRTRDKEALDKFYKKNKSKVTFYEWLQYEFFTQWMKFKKFANKNGVKIIGDIPIYVACDSADTWANPELFQMDENYKPTRVAGCPPDAFAAKGQLWGNPLYRWDYHKKTGYKWWISRVQACLTMYDVIRIDHFRGFDQYYSIAGDAEDAVDGYWEDGPNVDLFKAIKKELGQIDIIAEDLGYMTDTVRKMVRETGFPNMKVLEFAFDARDAKDGGDDKPNDYLPFTYDHNCVVYTGTHDNETLKGWLSSITEEEVAMARDYVGLDKKASQDDIVKGMIRAAYASPADYCIIPMQDYLCLDNSARINTPSTTGENWKWRMKKEYLTKGLRKEMKKLVTTYWR